MTNEIMRPITLIDYWDEKKPTEKTIDALSIHGVQLCYADFLGFYPRISYSPDGGFLYADKYIIGKPYNAVEEATAENMRILDAISEARNAPVLATEEVLAGLPKDAKLMTETHFSDFDIDPDDPDGVDNAEPYWGYYEPEFVDHYENFTFTSIFGERIKSNGCSKTADYLRQFTLQGVRRVENA